MPLGTIILLGAFAGLTIYLGLPIVFLRRAPQSLKMFLNMVTAGILVFLLFDITVKVGEPISGALKQIYAQHTGIGPFILDIFLFILGTTLGSVGLVYFNCIVFGQMLVNDIIPPEVEKTPGSRIFSEKCELTPRVLALLIAAGLGLHNFSEGLAIGQAATNGALHLALTLIVGFGLHNMTEGFGIAAPLAGLRVTWSFVGLLGLIGGGPTFLGTVTGIVFNSPQVFILFLALAAGAIIYVIVELLGIARRSATPRLIVGGLLLGFLFSYATDLIITYGGA